jgi:hypothetical protein
MKPSVIATLATQSALPDLQLLLGSLELWNKVAPKVYVACDSPTEAALKQMSYKGTIICVNILDKYTGYDRQQMEAMPGLKFKTLWFDFMCEKIALLQHAFSKKAEPILFCDADICFLAPLPEIPETATLALSPHMIRVSDEQRYGTFNGGFFWIKNPAHLDVWLTACKTRTFYEQKAMEAMCPGLKETPETYFFPRQINYGWWRMYQSDLSSDFAAAEWGLNRMKCAEASGIVISGEPLISIHTHFAEQRYQPTIEFNLFVMRKLQRLAGSHRPAKAMVEVINRNFPLTSVR